MKLAAFILGLIAVSATGATVEFAQPALTLAPGGSADVSVRLDESFADGLAAFGLTISYDPARIAVTATVVPALNHNYLGGPADVFANAGEISILGMTELSGDAFLSYGDRPLVTLHLTDLTGERTQSQITLSDFDASTQWVSPGLAELDSLVAYGQPLTVATPEPATVLLAIPIYMICRRRPRR